MADDNQALKEFSLAGKAGLVIGAEHPLGRIAALTLAEAGANLVVASQEPGTAAQLNDLLRELAPSGCKAVPHVQNAATRADLCAAVDLAVHELGGLEILVNACDYRWFGPTEASDDTDFDRVIENTFKTVWMACQEAGRTMLRHGGGVIVNIISILAERGVPNAGLYCATQAAVLNLTRALALEWAAGNVRVNALEFGWLESEAGKSWHDREFRESLIKYLPDRQLVTADELAGTLLYMVSPGAAFMTGQAVAVDGGLLCRP